MNRPTCWTDSRRLQKCGVIIAHARRVGLPIAFTRTSNPLGPSESWLEGFEPHRSDHVFELTSPSCYSNPLLEDIIQVAGCFAIAGLSLEKTILATLIEASFRGHRSLFLDDASFPGESDERLHRSANDLSGILATPIDTETWLAAVKKHKSEHNG